VNTQPDAPWQARLARFLARPWLRSVLPAVLVLLYTGWIGYQWVRDYLIDFNVYYIAAYGFRTGWDVYGMGIDYRGVNWPQWEALAAAAGVEDFTAPYRYPPLTAQLAAPLLPFSEQVAGMVWLGLTAAAFVVSAWWLGRLWTQPEGPSLVYLLMLGFVPPLTTLHAGQVNGFVLLALVAGYAGLMGRRPWLAGSALAVAALLKLLPLALCLYLGWRKQWRAATVCALTLVGLLLTAPLTLAPDILRRYGANFLGISEQGNLHPTAANQALSGFLARLLEGVVAYEVIYALYLGGVALLLVATVALCWPWCNLPHFWRYEYSLILCTLMLIPPYNWYHMLVLLLIPLVVMVEQLWRSARWRLLALLLSFYLLANVHGLFYHFYAHLRLLSSFPFLFVLLLWGMLAWRIVRERQAPGPLPATVYAGGD
jgi:alpha-1,2-mannosyltransferase